MRFWKNSFNGHSRIDFREPEWKITLLSAGGTEAHARAPLPFTRAPVEPRYPSNEGFLPLLAHYRNPQQGHSNARVTEKI